MTDQYVSNYYCCTWRLLQHVKQFSSSTNIFFTLILCFSNFNLRKLEEENNFFEFWVKNVCRGKMSILRKGCKRKKKLRRTMRGKTLRPLFRIRGLRNSYSSGWIFWRLARLWLCLKQKRGRVNKVNDGSEISGLAEQLLVLGTFRPSGLREVLAANFVTVAIIKYLCRNNWTLQSITEVRVPCNCTSFLPTLLDNNFTFYSNCKIFETQTSQKLYT